ncbi:uncharacterized protein LOC127080607 [Lathyrus oleraceus]|uniref:uncharacterized protein LOC127080607 n=1 Tax=Pisum sativum TaxID=3888 RepID=UPI0021D1E987|nr:uncharacterized protein LOC127080607 [Pisum sativum]
MKDRFRRNVINIFYSSSGRVEGVIEVKESVKCHFENFFKEANFLRPIPDGISRLSEEDNSSLEESFSESEIKEVIDKSISNNQTTFVPGRNILDGVLLVHEVFDFAKREKLIYLVLKVDYKKAYDSVSWNYLRFCFDKLGFGNKWKN